MFHVLFLSFQGHHVIHDRAFTNIPLAHALRKENATMAGTVQSNRKGLDVDAFEVESSRGAVATGHVKLECDLVHANKPSDMTLCFTRWMDSKGVNFLSTEVGAGVDVGECTTKKNTKASHSPDVYTDHFFQPLVRKVYNWLMGGVDGHDQLRAHGAIRLKRLRRWWVPMFIADIDMCTVNACIHHEDWHKRRFGMSPDDWKRSGMKDLSAKEFRLSIISSIIAEHCTDINPDQFPLGELLKRADNCRRAKG